MCILLSYFYHDEFLADLVSRYARELILFIRYFIVLYALDRVLFEMQNEKIIYLVFI